jgi:hypothetical protein
MLKKRSNSIMSSEIQQEKSFSFVDLLNCSLKLLLASLLCFQSASFWLCAPRVVFVCGFHKKDSTEIFFQKEMTLSKAYPSTISSWLLYPTVHLVCFQKNQPFTVLKYTKVMGLAKEVSLKLQKSNTALKKFPGSIISLLEQKDQNESMAGHGDSCL